MYATDTSILSRAARAFSLALLTLVLTLATSLYATAPVVAQDSPFSYSALEFGLDAPGAGLLPEVGAPVAPLSVSASVVSASNLELAPLWRQGEKSPVAILVVKTTATPPWHIYTATQGAGGKPTAFINLNASDASLTLGQTHLATHWRVEQDADGQRLEELEGDALWLTPIYSAADALDLTEATITGTVDALACSSAHDGACVPQKVDFTAKFAQSYDALDQALASAVEIANASATTETSPEAQESGASLPNSNAERTAGAQNRLAQHSFVILLLTAFFGGLILNITPCVLPVVGLKILSFFEQAGKSRASAFLLNVWYTCGVLLVFGVLAFASVGLSFLFTRSLFQIIMSVIVFAMALSLMGVWELMVPAFVGGEKSTQLTSKEGPVGAIFKGIITTLLAIPCGAPLLSPALDWASEATKQGNIGLVVVVYLVIGLGMASPFLIAGAFPELLKFFPKPGPWMETFRKAMGYFLLIATVWILYSAPIDVQLPTVALLFAVWFACWNIGRNQFEYGAPSKKAVGWLVSILVVACVTIFSYDFPHNPNRLTLQSASRAKLTRWAVQAQRAGQLEQAHWALFDQETLQQELAKGRVVAVDFTADWCMNCKFLEKTILHTEDVQAAFDAKNVLTLTADWTNLDAKTPDILAINALLDAQGARQVPTLMIFTPDAPDQPIVLRGLYSKGTLLDALATLP